MIIYVFVLSFRMSSINNLYVRLFLHPNESESLDLCFSTISQYYLNSLDRGSILVQLSKSLGTYLINFGNVIKFEQ